MFSRGRKLPHTDTGVAPKQREQRHLPRRNSQIHRLAPQLAVQTQDSRAQLVSNGDDITALKIGNHITDHREGGGGGATPSCLGGR